MVIGSRTSGSARVTGQTLTFRPGYVSAVNAKDVCDAMLSFTGRTYGLQSDSAERTDAVVQLVWLPACDPRWLAL